MLRSSGCPDARVEQLRRCLWLSPERRTSKDSCSSSSPLPVTPCLSLSVNPKLLTLLSQRSLQTDHISSPSVVCPCKAPTRTSFLFSYNEYLIHSRLRAVYAVGRPRRKAVRVSVWAIRIRSFRSYYSDTTLSKLAADYNHCLKLRAGAHAKPQCLPHFTHTFGRDSKDETPKKKSSLKRKDTDLNLWW